MLTADHQLPKGTRLNDLYEIEEHIADGGIGTVYRARDVESGDPVAIKVLLSSFSRDAMILDLFKREAKILRKLKHDALTQYFVFTREPTLGIYYLAMEFIGGPSLSQRLEEGPLEPEAVYRLVKRLASALQAVHESEVIHRDLSPDNIILPNSDVGQAKIIDFGISKAKANGPTIIGDGFAGKVNYVSPEQVGIFDGKVTPRSDIYSLGLVIAEALTGKQIDMGGTQVQIVDKRRQPPPLIGIDNRFRPLLEAMLQPDPANRPSSMEEIANWTLGAPLMGGMPDKTIIKPSGPPPEQALLDADREPVHWGRRIFLALSLLGIAGLGAAGVYLFIGQTVPDQDQKPVLVATPRDNAPAAPDVEDPVEADTASQTAAVDQDPLPADPPPTVPSIPGNDIEAGGTDTQQNVSPLTSLAPDPVGTEPTQSDLEPADRIRKFVMGYKGGDCMYLQPVQIAANTAEIEGFASRTPPFIAFDSEFTQSQGFEAKIQVNLVSDAQCPAISFLGATPQGNGATELHLDMQRTVVPNGGTMAGRISGFDPSAGELGLLFVDSKGTVANLSPFLQVDNGGAGFVVPLTLQSSVDEIGLIVAMVGPNMMSVLGNQRETEADAYFEQLVFNASVLRATATTVKVVP